MAINSGGNSCCSPTINRGCTSDIAAAKNADACDSCAKRGDDEINADSLTSSDTIAMGTT